MLPAVEATQDMIEEMRRAVREVAFDRMTRLLYSTDASIYQMMPVGVAYPHNADEVAAAVEIAARHGVPVLPRGGGSSLAGQAVNHALVLDLSRYMDRITYVDSEAMTVTAEAGTILGALNRSLAIHGLQFGPDPASADRAVVGGVIANNATGAHSIRYGMAVDNVHAVDVTLADGSRAYFDAFANWEERAKRPGLEGAIYRRIPQIMEAYAGPIAEHYPNTFRTVAGYNLDRLMATPTPNLAHLLTGSEGTLGVITHATLKLVPVPRFKRLALVHFDDLRASLEAVPTMLEAQPAAIELLDKYLMDLTRVNAEYGRLMTFAEGDPAAIQVVEFAGETAAEADAGVERLRAKLRGHTQPIVVLSDPQQQKNVWAIRKAGLGILMSVRGDSKPIPVIEDAAVPVEHLADYIESVIDVCHQAGVEDVAVYAHASAGCLHVRPRINLKEAGGVRQLREVAEGSVELVRRYRGSVSGEHGTGIVRSEFIDDVLGPELAAAFREVKAAFDPEARMNPGKIIDPPRMDDESLLRFGTGYAVPYEIRDTVISFQHDGGFAKAVEMCNGAGVCRKVDTGVMCPSYMVTRDEAHSTRGRANALRVAMNGHLGADGITSSEVHEVLDLCLSCKACKTECPSSVDMARMKSAFLHNYQQEHGVPLRSQLFARIASLNRLAQPVQPLANAMMRGPVKWVMNGLGVHPARTLPTLAPQSFSAWWRQREAAQTAGRKVVLFNDTFMEHNDPHIGRAAVAVLEALGCEVVVLERHGCCGRPAISKGMLTLARRQAGQLVKQLAPYAEANIPILGVEPSCAAALTDEHPDLVDDPRAHTIAEQTVLLDDFIADLLAEADTAAIFDGQPREILFHGHCHQKALFGPSGTMRMLQAIPNATVTLIDSTCCGMAGSFGYEAEHYDLSVKSARLSLVPAIEAAGPQTLIAATGTSCRDQIDHLTGRHPLHPIEIVAAALAAT